MTRRVGDGTHWKVAVNARGFVVIDKRHSPHAVPLHQRWHWANHPEGDPRRRPNVGMWICRTRPLIFTDYRKALRTAKRLNACARAGAARMAAYYEFMRQHRAQAKVKRDGQVV